MNKYVTNLTLPNGTNVLIKDSECRTNLSNEIRRATAKETELEDADTHLRNDLTTETNARKQIDTALQQNINAEVSAREQGDNKNNAEIAKIHSNITGIENKNTEQDNELTKLRTMISSPYNFKGDVASISSLPASGNINDTYYVQDVKYKVTWTGSAWVQSSLSEYDYQTELGELNGELDELSGNSGVKYIDGEYLNLLNEYQYNWLKENISFWYNDYSTVSIGTDGVISITRLEDSVYVWYLLNLSSFFQNDIGTKPESIYKDKHNYDILYLYGNNGYINVESSYTIGIPKKLKYDKNNSYLSNNEINYSLGGMDNGVPNNDNMAIHTSEFLEITQSRIAVKSESGCAIQVFDTNFNYLGVKLFHSKGINNRKFYDIKNDFNNAKYVKVCFFKTNDSTIAIDDSKSTIESLGIEYWGLRRIKYEEKEKSFLTTAFKASSIGDTTLFSRKGEGTIDQIQLIGAYDTTGASKHAFWPNYYRTQLTVVADGEIALQGTIYDLCGLSSQVITDEEYANGIFENAIFDTPLFAKTGLYSGITFKFKIPYYESIEVKISGTNGLMWGMVKSLSYVDLNVGGVKIPYGAKFHGVTVSKECVKGNQIELMNTDKNGMLLGINISGKSTAFDWVEGCIRAFKYGATTQDKCTMLSSGLEDYLGGAFGYNVGEKQFTNFGCTLNKMTSEDGYRVCGYRNHINDNVVFSAGGFRVTGRWGDQNASEWNLDSTDNFAGQTTEPGNGTFIGTAFYYEWN